MTDNELLLAISEIIEKKLKAEIEPLKTDIRQIRDEQTRINVIQIEAMQADIEVIKSVIKEHSEKLQKIS